jgi:hypothetical protein
MSTFLVIADRNAWSMGLCRTLCQLGGRNRTTEWVLIVPAEPSVSADEGLAMREAHEASQRAQVALRNEGLTVLKACAGPPFPRKALEEEMNRPSRQYDGIVLATGRRHASLQIQPNLVSQLEGRYGIPVRLIDQSNVHALRN